MQRSLYRAVTVVASVTWLLIFPVTGASSQGDSARAPQAIGALIDIGGFRLHLDCRGRGHPTVIMEAGAGDFSFDWALVQPVVSAFTRVCTYDRAGYAWSDPGPTPRTLRQLSTELRALMRAGNERGPFVLVGHSFGGLIVRTYAATYPRDVVGMLLIDATHEDNDMMLNGKTVMLRDLSRHRPIPPARLGPQDRTPSGAEGSPSSQVDKVTSPYDRLPAGSQALWLWATGQPAYSSARSSEFDYLAEEVALMHDVRLKRRHVLGQLPLIVLTRGDAVGRSSRVSLALRVALRAGARTNSRARWRGA